LRTRRNIERPLAGHDRSAGDRRAVQAIILAAGRGSRLEEITRTQPKCLVEVGGGALIEHQLRTLAMVGIDDVTVVAGYCVDAVRGAVGSRARILVNDAWACTNSLYSISLCAPQARAATIVMNCDVLVHPLALHRLLDVPGSAFLYDSSSGESEEHMKVELQDGRFRAISKDLPHHCTHGENVGVLYFEAAGARSLFQHAGQVLAEGERGAWMAAAVERVARTTPLYGVDIADLPWIEIDFPEDLGRARGQIWPHVNLALAPTMALAA
jgi:L-glutamine-phosphate cytidylyltransferase